MNEQSTTQTLGGTTVVFGWIEEARVEQVLHASDGFQLLLGISLAGLGGVIACAVGLGAGALHPIGLYIVLAGLLVATVITGALAGREFKRYHSARKELRSVTARVPVPVVLVTPGSPSFTVGGQQLPVPAVGSVSTGATPSSSEPVTE